jgi:hypothetical protein
LVWNSSGVSAIWIMSSSGVQGALCLVRAVFCGLEHSTGVDGTRSREQ